jgi:hypothetical protein
VLEASTSRLLLRAGEGAGLERGGCPGGGLPSTLLGPETTGHVSGVSGSSTGHEVRVIPAGLLVVVSRVAWWVRPLLENCIVDASIFEFFQDCDRET